MRKTFLALAGLALLASPVLAGKFNRSVEVGQKAPGFESMPAVDGDKDTSVSLADVKEDVVVLAFLANHCPAVVATEDRVIDLASDFKGKSVKVIGISVTTSPSQKDQDDISGIKARFKEKKYNFVYGYDESQKSGRAYGAVATPTFFVLDKTRTIRYMGALDDSTFDESKAKKNYVRDAVEAVLKGESVEITETKAVGCGIAYSKK